jgi:hypothetical protein
MAPQAKNAMSTWDPSALEAALWKMARREQKRVVARVKVDLPAFAGHPVAQAWLAELCGRG